ncbi:hypothetical protein FLK61_26150 [Paenalkalicoccus suaedae]|uniref:Uncharacterized protein n=1 Tax=Paenalkalicoccus suaedae TaxID=2592382 RepID=A0A859FDB8_9BACI|nr:hypothetical protein [Paenalkalicoccus suaedae]QKS70245.1 hypothetical protein FLK61_26150 [Paenalkalicoccus suaedae]
MSRAERIKELEEYLKELKEARSKVLQGQAYRINDRQITRADGSFIVSEIKETEKKLIRLKGSRRRNHRFVPRDL